MITAPLSGSSSRPALEVSWRVGDCNYQSSNLTLSTAGIKHQEVDHWLRLKTYGIDQRTTEDKVPAHFIKTTMLSEKGEVKVMYMQENDLFYDEEEGI